MCCDMFGFVGSSLIACVATISVSNVLPRQKMELTSSPPTPPPNCFGSRPIFCAAPYFAQAKHRSFFAYGNARYVGYKFENDQI